MELEVKLVVFLKRESPPLGVGLYISARVQNSTLRAGTAVNMLRISQCYCYRTCKYSCNAMLHRSEVVLYGMQLYQRLKVQDKVQQVCVCVACRMLQCI